MKTNQLQKNIDTKWSEETLENIAIPKGMVRGPFGGALKKDIFVSSGYKVYEQKNAIYQSIDIGSYYVGENKFNELKRFSVEEGDFIISCSGTIGKIFQIPRNAPNGIINQALLKITIDKSKMHDRFFYYHFILPKFQSLVIDNTQGGAMQNLVGMDIFRNTTMFVPPLSEQVRIVSVLETWDKAIEKLSKKIEIKKQIKKGLMQDLLTGKKRLKGFSDKWEIKKIDELIIKQDKTNRQSGHSLDFGKYPFFNNSSRSFDQYLDEYDFEGEMIIANTGGVAYFDYYSGKFAAMSDCFVFTTKQSVKFIFFKLKFLENLINNLGFTGSGIKHLDKKYFLKIKIELPCKDEQNAIAQIITIANKEITELEKKLSVLKEQKRYLLNNLITGTIRTPETLSTK